MIRKGECEVKRDESFSPFPFHKSMKSLLEYSDGEIALILVGGGVLAALTMCLGLCGLLHG